MVARVALSVEKYERWGIAALDLIDYFAPAYVSGQTFNGVFGEFELRVEPSGCQFDSLFAVLGETGVGGKRYHLPSRRIPKRNSIRSNFYGRPDQSYFLRWAYRGSLDGRRERSCNNPRPYCGMGSQSQCGGNP